MPSSPLLAFLIIDNQLAFAGDTSYYGVARSNSNYEQNLVALLRAFRALSPPAVIVHVAHHSTSKASPLHPSKRTTAIAPTSQPIEDEMVIYKSVNSAFIDTGLEEVLRNSRIQKLYCAGLTLDHCVSTTVRMASNLGVCDEVVLVEDATACFQKTVDSWNAATVHAIHAESLQEFATIMTTEEVLSQVKTA